jgi:hypothetical protein
MQQNLTKEADGFTSHQMEGLLRIVIALKNSSHSAGLKPENLWSIGKHAKQYTTEEG